MRRTMAGLDAADLDSRVGAWMSTRFAHVEAGGSWPSTASRCEAVGEARVGPLFRTCWPRWTTSTVWCWPNGLSRTTAARSPRCVSCSPRSSSRRHTDVVVTADALHCQRLTAQTVIDEGGHYVLTVKGNQPGLRNQLKDLPWSKVTGHTYLDTGHGRRVRRTIKAVQVPAWVDWPGAKQVLFCV